MNIKLDAFTMIVAGAIVLGAARIFTGGMKTTPEAPSPPSGSTPPPTDDWLIAPINDDEYADIPDDELFDGITA